MNLNIISKLKYHFLSAFVLIVGLFSYPLLVFNLSGNFGASYLELFTLPIISLFSFSFALLSFNRLASVFKSSRELFLTILLFSVFPFIHFFYYQTYDLNNFAFAAIWFTIPLIVYLNSQTFNILLPAYFYLFWVWDLMHTFFNAGEKIGIAGNRNWQAIFLVFSMMFAVYCIIQGTLKLKQSNRLKQFILSVFITVTLCFTIYSLYVIKLCDSRGAWLSLGICSVLFIFFSFKNSFHFSKKYTFSSKIKKLIILFFCCLMVLVTIFTIFFRDNLDQFISYELTASSESRLQVEPVLKKMEQAFNDDVRIPMWYGAVKLILANPLIGVGSSRYESEYAAYRPISYFLKPNAATRSNHPHNVMLYVLASYGIPGFTFWSILFIYPLIFCLWSYRTLTSFEKLALYGYLCLFIHGQLDLILFVWPTLFIALLLLGILWKCTFYKSVKEEESSGYNVRYWSLLRILSISTGTMLLAFALYKSYEQFIGSYYNRTAFYYEKRGEKNLALNYYTKAVDYVKNPRFIYKASLMSIYDFNCPNLALKFFSLYNTIPTKNYAHNNGFIALCFMKKGEMKAAMPFLYREVVHYPASTGAWYRLFVVQRYLKMKNAAKQSRDNMYKTLELKNLPKSALDLVLKNPEYDKHPHKIPQKLLRQ